MVVDQPTERPLDPYVDGGAPDAAFARLYAEGRAFADSRA